VAGKVIPTATHGTNWSGPSLKAAAKLRSSTVNCVWGSTSKNRCIEVVLGILNDPTRVDHTFAAVARTVSDARRMLRKSEDRYSQTQEIFTHCKEEDMKIPGPVHGLIEKLGLARSQMYFKQNGELHIKTPLGADVASRTPHGTLR
jgi:hypothetical protein